MSATLSLFDWRPPVAAPRAPEGVKRAARAGAKADPAILTVARRHVGEEISKATFWAEANAIWVMETDTPRRRLAALADQGIVVLGEPTKLGHVLVLAVRA